MDMIEFTGTGRANRVAIRMRLRALSDIRRRQQREGKASVALG